MSRTVVIALDSSDSSARALPFAESVARQWGSRVVLVHASVADDAHASVPIDARLRLLARRLTEAGILADVVVRTTPPAQTIADVVSEQHADLIIMASHQRSGINRWLNGSVTEQVLLKTCVPLLVIPAASRPPSGEGIRVLVPLDGSDVGEAPLEFFRGRPTRPTDLVLLRVVSLSPIVIGLVPGFTAEPLSAGDLETELHNARDYLARRAEAVHKGSITARYQTTESADPIARVIIDVAKREHADVIALGSHAKAGVSRLVLGSVSEEILEHSPVPVLLVRKKQREAAGVADRTLLAAGNGAHG